MRITVDRLQDVKPEEPLVNSRYSVRIARKDYAKKDDGKLSLVLNMRVTAGPAQPDGNPSEDREISDFFPLNNYETMKDGGKYVKGKLASMLVAAQVPVDAEGSFDDDELIDKEFDIITKIKEDNNGVPQTDVTRYLSKA